MPLTGISDHVLMLVVRKLDRELPFFRPGWLTSIVGITECEASAFSGRGAHVANGADGWTGTAESLARKELLAVTTHAGLVIGKISDIGKISFGVPRGWDFVTGIAGKALMPSRRMKERRVFRGRTARSLLLRRRFRGARPAASLCGDNSDGATHDDE